MRAVIYKRVSTKMQVDKYSLDVQEKILRECIDREGSELVEVYADEGISGERASDRPSFLRLLNDAEAGKFDAVWVIDQNRLSRGDIAELSYIKKVFKDNNIIICTPNQRIDLSDIEDDFISNLFGIIAERERRKTKQSADRGRREQFEKGEWGGRTPPFGYYYDPSKSKSLLVDPREARVYRLIVELFLDNGYGCKKVAQELKARGIKTREGSSEWSDRSLNYMLKNPIYKGYQVHKKYKKTIKQDGRYGWQSSRGGIIGKGKHRALISEEKFEEIQNRIAHNRNKNRLIYHTQLLTGYLECSECGNTFKVGSTGGPGRRKVVYRCKTKFAYWNDKNLPDCPMSKTFGVEEYNSKIWERIQEVARQPAIIRQALMKASKPKADNLALYKEELEYIKKGLKGFDECRDRAVKMRIKGLIEEEELDRQLIDLAREKKDMSRRKLEIESKIDFLERSLADRVDEKLVLKYVKYLYQSNKKLDINQKKRVLNAFVSRVPIAKDGKFEIVFKFPIPEKTLTFEELMRKMTGHATIGQTEGSAQG